MSINCVPPCDELVGRRLLEKFEIRVGSKPSQLFVQLEDFLQELQAYFEWFIFLFLPDDMGVIRSFFLEDPTDKAVQKKNEKLFLR